MVNEEASIDTLFHVTSTTTAIKILEQDSFLLALSETNTSESFVSWLGKNDVRVKFKRNIPKLFYLSFARTPASGYIADRATGLTSVKEPVMFVVNGRQLKNINRNSTFVPQDYWHNSDENGRQLGASREAEERFYSANPRTKLGSALIEIRIIADTHGNDRVHSSLRKLILLCKKKNIVLKLFSKENKAGFIRGVESNEDRAKALAYILSKTNKDKPWSQYKREPGRDLLFLKDLLEKNSYYEISEKDRSSLYYYLSGLEIYGDLAKHFSSTIHNIRGGRDEEKEFLYALLKKHNITNLSKMFIMLQAKWTRLRDEYYAEEDRKRLLSRETKEAASIETEEEALSKANLPALTNKKWRADLTKWAKQKGFIAIGKGAYGKVFYSKEKPDIVIKVFSDLSYRFWYKIAIANKSNPCVPRFIGAPVKIANGLWAVRMEKLEPLTESDKNNTLKIEAYTRYHARQNYGIPTATNISLRYKDSDYDEIRKTILSDDMEELLMDLLWSLSKGENSLKYMLDLHSGNFMKRGNTLVLVDPLQLVNESLRSLFRISKPSTKEDAMALDKFAHLDVLSYVPVENPKTEEAGVVEVAESVNNRKTFMTMPGVKQVLIGPKNGPLIPVMYSAEARMFFPVFKE